MNSGDIDTALATIMMSWSTADVEGKLLVGGLLGQSAAGSDDAVADNNWAAGDVSGSEFVGGFSGSSSISEFTRNWSAGAVSDATNVGGFLGIDYDNPDTGNVYNYWNLDTSDQTDSVSADGVVVQTLTVSDFGGNAAAAAWDFGDSDISNGDADFPLLKDVSQPWQAVNLARALTRVLRVNDFGAVAVAGTIIHTDLLRLDTNGLAANERADGTSAPSCSLDDDGVLRAQTNYNDITVELSLLTDGGQSFVAASNNCEVEFANAAEEFAATLRLEISAPAIGADAARSLTTDYALRIAPDLPADALAKFVAEIEEGDFDWFGDRGTASSLDWDNDGIENPYDWTPASVAIDGEPIEVNLTLNGSPDGSSRNSWPIFNVWQLQAIDGVSVSHIGATSGNLTLFGNNAGARLRAEYRLAMDIDATPTKKWDSEKGFNPIGGNFKGFFDGRGYAVRGLFINRTGNNVGLFASMDGQIADPANNFTDFGKEVARNLGVEDADISGNNIVGILAGFVTNASYSRIWTTGKVVGSGNIVGGLIGRYFTDSGIGNRALVNLNWSTADVRGDEQIGGLFGENRGETTILQTFDNWAGGNVIGGKEVGGFSGSAGSGSDNARNWSSGAVSGGVTVGGFAPPTDNANGFDSAYWNLDTSGVAESAESRGIGAVVQTLIADNFGGDAESAAWDFGDSDISDNDADFPFLKFHNRPWQAVNLARALTRFLAVSDAATITAMAGMTVTTSILRLDTNGLADDDESTAGTSTPTCSFNGGVLRAETNYNGVTVDLSLLTGGNQRFVEAANCEAAIRSGAVEFAATLRLEISAPAIGDDAARVLTTDYAMQITLTASTRPSLDIVAPSEAIMVAANASAGVTVLTVMVIGENNPSFAAKNNGDLQTEGGVSVATIILSKAATAAFDSDGLILSLTLTATNDGGDTETAEVRFVSAPRGINPDPIVKQYALGEASGNVLEMGESQLSIWHYNGARPEYVFVGDGSDFTYYEDSELVQISGLGAGIYDFELEFRGDGVTATLSVQVIVGDAPLAIGAVDDPVIVAADASADTKILTVSVSGGTNPSFASVEIRNLQTEGGADEAVIVLSTTAIAAFRSDNLILPLTLTATNEDGETAMATIRFASAPRALDGGRFAWVLASPDATAGGVVLSGITRPAIWHFNGVETAELIGKDSALFALRDNGKVIEVASDDLVPGGEDYLFTLQLSGGGLIATRDFLVSVAEPLAAESIVEPITVAANATLGAPVLTMTVRGGKLSGFESVSESSQGGKFKSESGKQATVLLARPAAAAFDSDGVTLTIELKASGISERATATVRFVSKPRAFSQPGRRAIFLSAAQAESGDEVLAAGDSGIAIWHNGGKATEYSLQGGDSNRFSVAAASGQIVVGAEDLPLGRNNFQLLVSDGALTATLKLRVDVNLEATDEAVLVFLDEIESGKRQWRGVISRDDDWDGDGIANVYDYTPTSVNIRGEMVAVNLNRGFGFSADPYRIYNVWQLQAIDGISVSRQGRKTSRQSIFGGNRLSRHYRLATNIDATPTREWKDSNGVNTDGFDPIGSLGNSGEFSGSLDGAGREIRGLYMVLNDDHGALFYKIRSGATVSRLGLPNVEVIGNGNDRRAAAVAHESNGLVSLVWATGDIVSNDGFVGGLVRSIGTGGQLRESWFIGKVRGKSSTGGLVGYGGAGDVRDSWAVARVEWSRTGSAALGGLVGASENSFGLHNSWSGGLLDTSATEHALIGGSGSFSNQNYFDRSISSANIDETRAQFVVETMVTVTDADSTWSTDVWSFGDTDVSDDAADYPFLSGFEEFWPGLQAFTFANFQTENLINAAINSGGTTPLGIGENITLTMSGTRGLATAAPTPAPTCKADATEAELNYNNITVRLQTTGEGSAVFTDDCKIVIRFADSASSERFAVNVLLATKKLTMSRWTHSFELRSFFAPLSATDIVVPADAPKGYEFLTVSLLKGEFVIDDDGRAPIIGRTTRRAMVDIELSADQLTAVFALSDGGATALFARDEEVFYDLQARNGDFTTGIDDALSVRSAPRARAATPSPATITLTRVRVGAEILTPNEAGVEIWHTFGAPETYSAQPASHFGVDETTGLVTIATELSANTSYELTLQLTDGTETAMREFRLIVGDGEQPAEKAKLVVLSALRSTPEDVVVTLAWREVEYADRYTLSRADGSAADGAYRSIYEGGGEQVSQCLTAGPCDSPEIWQTYTETDLTVGSVYYYRLDSCNDFGCAETSEVLSLSVSLLPEKVFDAKPTGKATLESSVIELAPGFVAAFVQWDVLLTVDTVTAPNGDTAAVTTSLPYRYILSRASSSGGSYRHVNTQPPVSKTTRRLSYYDPNAALNDVYYYRLVACNDVGCGPRSDILTLTVTLTPKETEDLVAPETLMARANPVAKAAAILMTIDGAATLVPSAVVVSNPVLIWSPVLGAMRYRIFRAIGDAETLTEPLANGAQEYYLPDGDYEVIDTVIGVSVEIADCSGNVVCPAGAKKFTDPAELTLEVPSLTLQKAYYYQVAACNAEDCGPVSDSVRVGGPVPPGPTPEGVPEIVVEEFRVDDSNNNLVEADLSWNEVTGANRYRLLRAQIGGGYEVIYEADVSYFSTNVLSDDVDFIRSQGNSFTDTDLSPGEIYFYRAQGCSGTNCGDVSDAATLRLQRPGRAKVSFDESGSSRSGLFVDAMTLDASGELQKTGASVWIASSSVTMAWEETPNADYYYVLRGGSHRDDATLTVSYPEVVGSITVAGVTSFSVTLTLHDDGGHEVTDDGAFVIIAPVPTATITQSFTITTKAATVTTFAFPIPVFGNAYTDRLTGDDIRHYWTRACNAFGCGELSDAVVLGGGLLGIDASDDNRTVVSVRIDPDGAVITAAIADTPNEILKTPTNVEASLCQAEDDGRMVPRAVVNWDIRDIAGEEKRFYRISRSRDADGASADLVILSPGGAPGSVGEIKNFDHRFEGELSSVALYYGVQECTQLQLNSLGVLDEDSQICSAPAVAVIEPVSAFPNCDDGSISPPQVNENLDQVTIRADLSEARITAAAIRFDAGREYVIASVAFVVKWDATPGAVYYLVTRESRNLYTGESESAEFAAEEGETVYEDIMSASSDVVNIYRVQACDRVDGCGPQSDPLELIAPSPAATPPLFVPSPVISVRFVDPFYAVEIKIAGALLANRYVLSRAPMPDPSDDQTLVYTDLDESGEAFEFTDGVIAGMQYFYRTRACNALGCATSEEVLISVGPLGPPPVAQTPAPDATQNVIGDVSRVEFELELPLLEVQVDLQWDAVANAEIYILTRAETESGPATEIYRGRERTHIDENVEFGGGDYHYRLQVCNVEGCASTSEPASISLVTRLVGQTPAPTATKNGALPQVNVQWDAVANAQTYILSRSRAESGDFFGVVYRGEDPTYIDENVEIGGGYSYRLQACNAASCASISDSSELFVLTN